MTLVMAEYQESGFLVAVAVVVAVFFYLPFFLFFPSEAHKSGARLHHVTLLAVFNYSFTRQIYHCLLFTFITTYKRTFFLNICTYIKPSLVARNIKLYNTVVEYLCSMHRG